MWAGAEKTGLEISRCIASAIRPLRWLKKMAGAAKGITGSNAARGTVGRDADSDWLTKFRGMGMLKVRILVGGGRI
jgi:hypothetical protein